MIDLLIITNVAWFITMVLYVAWSFWRRDKLKRKVTGEYDAVINAYCKLVRANSALRNELEKKPLATDKKIWHKC
tara:strand:- start:3532 stop:3756 length:225 start_codon:yes stop_codon:yes gene_type:complete